MTSVGLLGLLVCHDVFYTTADEDLLCGSGSANVEDFSPHFSLSRSSVTFFRFGQVYSWSSKDGSIPLVLMTSSDGLMGFPSIHGSYGSMVPYICVLLDGKVLLTLFYYWLENSGASLLGMRLTISTFSYIFVS